MNYLFLFQKYFLTNKLKKKEKTKYKFNLNFLMEAYSNLKESYTRSELEILNNFKIYCANKKLEYRTDLYTNDFLIKFLRAKKYKMEESYQMFTKYLKFSIEYNIENINKVEFPNIEKIKIFYPHGFHKTTKTGNPIFIQNLGEIKINDINRLLPDKKLNQYIINLLEIMKYKIFPKCSITFNKPIDRIFCIVDLLGLTTSLMNKKIIHFLNTQLSICQNYYPGILDGLYFVNTGFIFKILWSTCKYFYDESTRRRIQLLGFDYKNQLLEKVSSENLPKFIGGDCNCDPYGCIFSEAGPWNNNNKDNKSNNNNSFIGIIHSQKNNEIYEHLTLKSNAKNSIKSNEEKIKEISENDDIQNVNNNPMNHMNEI